MWETAVFYFNHTSELIPQLNEWLHDHPGVELRNFRHEASKDPERGANIWLFDFKKFGS